LTVSFRVCSHFSLFLQTIAIFAPSFAKPIAVVLPIPELTPVIKQTLSFVYSSKYLKAKNFEG